MKARTYTLLLTLICGFGFAQKQTAFRLYSLPKRGVVLDKNWRWHAGDNPVFASADFNDATWNSIDPTKEIDDLPQLQKAGLGWLRLKIKIDTSLRNTVVGMMVNQVVASEIYLNGHQIANFGKVSIHPNEVIAYNPSGEPISSSQIIHFQLNNEPEQVLAVRFAVKPSIPYLRFLANPNPFVKIRLGLADRMNENSVESRGYFDISFTDYLKSGIFFILGLLHLIFYSSYRLQKANLYFCFYCLNSAIFFFLHPFAYQYVHSVSIRMYLFIIFWLMSFATQVFLINAVYRLFQYRIGTIYKALILYTIAYFFYFVWQREWSGPLGILFLILPNLEVTRVSVLAIIKKTSGAWMIMFGALGYAAFFSAFLLNQYLTNNIFIKVFFEHFLSNIAILSLPIAITTFLAIEFAQTTRSLAIKLKEVETLSLEKQLILEAQNETLEKQVIERTTELRQSLDTLKSTQTQLIQKEKLASLGELTAGIAHEIQNPLNFVNNFSELSIDLIKELREEKNKEKEKRDEALEDELLEDLSQNQEKINLHGKRASSIVKGMLEHSRASTGKKELTDINALADEYLRLSYHGLKAKDSTFTADFKTDFEVNLPKMEVVPQYMGRVLMNLFNNAFYAVSLSRTGSPCVQVSTRKLADSIEIRVKDNGIGMSEATKAKIFQPFFTTKPTGEGTGLGLSLAYDIVTKIHGGTIDVESTEGRGSEFIIKLPI